MPTKFLDSFGGKLAERWFTTLFTPAFIFWFGGLVAWVYRFSWSPLITWLESQDTPVQYALLVISLLVVSASTFVISQFELSVLRFLEGYWPKYLRSLRQTLIERQRRFLKRKEQEWQKLALRQEQGLTSEETEDFVSLDWQLRQFPTQGERLMPTKLGNLLRAAEEQSLNKYGLDAIICWSRLWLVLPEEMRKELEVVRADLNTTARIWLWSLLFLVWSTLKVWWSIPVGLFSAWLAYIWMLRVAEDYADLIESAFDLHRQALYKSLRWPLPSNPAEEHKIGQQLTAYLWRGSNRTQPNFVNYQK